MKFRILRSIEAARLADVVPPPLRRRLPGALRSGGPYTVVLFPLNQDPVRSGAVAKAVARLGERDAARTSAPEAGAEPMLAFGADFTAEAQAILAAHGAAVVSVGDFHWTDASFARVRESVASPKKARGGGAGS